MLWTYSRVGTRWQSIEVLHISVIGSIVRINWLASSLLVIVLFCLIIQYLFCIHSKGTLKLGWRDTLALTIIYYRRIPSIELSIVMIKLHFLWWLFPIKLRLVTLKLRIIFETSIDPIVPRVNWRLRYVWSILHSIFSQIDSLTIQICSIYTMEVRIRISEPSWWWRILSVTNIKCGLSSTL
jgi:hypothetical protein